MSLCYAYARLLLSNNGFCIPLIKIYVLYFELRECSADQSLAGGQKQTCGEGEILSNNISSALMWYKKQWGKPNTFGKPEFIFIMLNLHIPRWNTATPCKICFLAPGLFSVSLWGFLLPGLSSPLRGGQQPPRVEGLLTPRGAGAEPWGCSPVLLLLVPGVLWSWWLPPALGVFIFSWSMGHSYGSAQAMENSICGAVPALPSAMHKAFCSIFFLAGGGMQHLF